MKFFLLIIVIFLTSCNPSMIKNDFNFNQEMTFEEFKIKLEKYANSNSYPEIDN